MGQWLADALIRRAKRTPYFHLYDADGSTYMERYWLVPYVDKEDKPGCHNALWYRQPITWLVQRFGLAIRLHLIRRADNDRVMHDHPWDFWSTVLRGWYIEARPFDNGRPCFTLDCDDELDERTLRAQGSVAFRRATDRHRIVEVAPGGVWTLFVTSRPRHWWGFYTPIGKVYYQDYESRHNLEPVDRATT